MVKVGMPPVPVIVPVVCSVMVAIANLCGRMVGRLYGMASIELIFMVSPEKTRIICEVGAGRDWLLPKRKLQPGSQRRRQDA